jgi:hypothetical protein
MVGGQDVLLDTLRAGVACRPEQAAGNVAVGCVSARKPSRNREEKGPYRGVRTCSECKERAAVKGEPGAWSSDQGALREPESFRGSVLTEHVAGQRRRKRKSVVL